MDRHIFRYDSANQTISKFALTITIVGHSLTTGRSKGVSTWLRHCGPLAHNTHLIIYTHACTREAAISRTTSMQPAFLSRLACSTYQLYCASKALSCFVPMVKHHQETLQAPPTNCPRIEKPPPIDKPTRHAE